MNRRNAIRRTTILLGGAISAPAILGVMSGCKADPTLPWEAKFVTPEEGQTMTAMVDRIIPRTDTPGAVDAGVPQFMDSMLADYYPEEERTAFREALAQIEADADEAYGDSFAALAPEQQDELLTRYDQAAFGDGADQEHFFRKIKELTVLGFCTSELGATEFLEYDPVPGDYKGCIPFEEVGKTWAT